MNSCLYQTQISHQRFSPKAHAFTFNAFYFYLDLDELPQLTQDLWGLGYEQAHLYSLKSTDHLQMGHSSLKENIHAFLQQQGITESIEKISLLTHLRTLGHLFNPISLFFITTANHKYCLAEVGNTFKEQKLYLLPQKQGNFHHRQTKHFYVSPFIKADADFLFQVKEPDKTLDYSIKTIEQGQTVLNAHVQGVLLPLTQFNLLKTLVSFPLLTLRVIGRIHLEALKLYLKRLPFYPKNYKLDLQQGVLPWRK